MWTNLADKPDTLEIEELIAHVQDLRHRMVDRLRSTRGRGTQVFLKRLLRRIHRIDDLAAIENWLRTWRDTLQEIPGRAWRPLA